MLLRHVVSAGVILSNLVMYRIQLTAPHLVSQGSHRHSEPSRPSTILVLNNTRQPSVWEIWKPPSSRHQYLHSVLARIDQHQLGTADMPPPHSPYCDSGNYFYLDDIETPGNIERSFKDERPVHAAVADVVEQVVEDEFAWCGLDWSPNITRPYIVADGPSASHIFYLVYGLDFDGTGGDGNEYYIITRQKVCREHRAKCNTREIFKSSNRLKRDGVLLDPQARETKG